jgi:Mg-chelatase subunit ChlD
MSFDPQQDQDSVNPLLSLPRRQMIIPRSGVSRPAWLNRSNKQLAVLVRDCSGSMSGDKALDATRASQGLVSELAQPANRDGFEVAVINFESSAKLEHDVTLASELAGRISSVHGGAGTDIASGLEIAVEILSRPQFQSESYLRPVVVAFSDGCTSNRRGAETIANAMKFNADLVTVAFGTDADEVFLQNIASSPAHFYRCSDGKSLRAFFAAVGATLCMSLQRGQNATHALSQVRF